MELIDPTLCQDLNYEINEQQNFWKLPKILLCWKSLNFFL